MRCEICNNECEDNKQNLCENCFLFIKEELYKVRYKYRDITKIMILQSDIKVYEKLEQSIINKSKIYTLKLILKELLEEKIKYNNKVDLEIEEYKKLLVKNNGI